eukprot:g3745.t1
MTPVPAREVLAMLAGCNRCQNTTKASGATSVTGQAVYNALRCGSLLCNFRRGAVPDEQRPAVEDWLAEHWTLHGPCLEPFRRFTSLTSDPFPLGCTVLGAPLFATAA